MDYKQKYLKYKQKYLRLLKDQKGGQPFLVDILAGLAFSWLFERNQRHLQLIYTGIQPVMMQPLGNITLNHKYRLNLLGISGLSIILTTRLVQSDRRNNKLELQLAKRIMSRTNKLPEISLPTTAAPLTGHSGTVYSVAFHPMAPLLATGSDDETVKLWRLVTTPDNSSVDCVATLDSDKEGHSNSVRSVAFHPTAPLLATGSADRTLKLWQLSSDNLSATCVATLDRSNGGHSNFVRSVAFHPKAPLLATSSYDETVRLWRLVTTPDGLISSTTCVAILDRRNGGHNDLVLSVAFHPTAPLLATCSTDRTVKLWQLSSDNLSATCVATLDRRNGGHNDHVRFVAFHPTAPLLATGSDDSTVKLWRLVTTPDGLISSATCVETLDKSNGGHISYVLSIAFHPTAPLLATGSHDNTVKLWQLSSDNSSATCVATLDRSNGGHSYAVNSVAFHPTAPLLATSSHDNAILWKL
jgi:WD40 repeat protein